MVIRSICQKENTDKACKIGYIGVIRTYEKIIRNLFYVWLEKQYKDIYQDMSIMYGIIEIHFLHCLTKNAEKFLHSVNNQLNELGIKIQYSVLQGEDNEVR